MRSDALHSGRAIAILSMMTSTEVRRVRLAFMGLTDSAFI